jgi:hypothetical protein
VGANREDGRVNPLVARNFSCASVRGTEVPLVDLLIR